jgi:hypothetical protein
VLVEFTVPIWSGNVGRSRDSHGFGPVILAGRRRGTDSEPHVRLGEGTYGCGPEIVGEKGKRPDLERQSRTGQGKVADLELKSWPGEVTVPIWTSEAFVAAKDKRSHLNVRMWFWNRGQSWPASGEGDQKGVDEKVGVNRMRDQGITSISQDKNGAHIYI